MRDVSGFSYISEALRHTFAATLHHLIIALHVGRDEDDLGSKTRPSLFQELHGIWSSSSFLRVPEDHSLRLDMLADQTRNRWSERFLLIRAYPDEEPKGMSE